MTEWGVVVVIIALVGLMAAIVGPIIKLTKAITKLTVTAEVMDDRLSTLTSDNKESHRRLWDHNKLQDDELKNHETRIHDLESDKRTV